MKILVTGGAGYIGGTTAKELLDRGHFITILDDLSEGHSESIDSRAEFVKGSVGDAKVLKKIFSHGKFDAVMHFAASCLVPESVQNPKLYYENNVSAGLVLLHEMIDHKVPKIIFSSSCAVYGEPEEMPITENTIKNPSHPYGETKLAFERILKWYSKAYNFTAVSLRYFNAAGATSDHGEHHDPETHLIPNVLNAALGRIPHLEVYGTDYPTEDGTCIRDYIHVVDIAEAHILALNFDRSESFNLGNANGYSVKQVIESAEKVCGLKVPMLERSRRAGDPPCLIANAKKIHEELGWVPKLPKLKEMISSAWDWMKAHPHGYGKK